MYLLRTEITLNSSMPYWHSAWGVRSINSRTSSAGGLRSNRANWPPARRRALPDGPTAVGYGGARGGGKSHWLVAQMGVDDCQRLPNLKCLLLRKVGKSNR